jgi:predicted metal-dependent phosphoesterase TrpH
MLDGDWSSDVCSSDLARELKLKAIAITDHDTLSGISEILCSVPTDDPFVLTGVEISSYPPDPFVSSGSFHILGFGIRVDNPGLNHALDIVQQARNDRNPKIISRLVDLGMDITMAEVTDEAGGQVIGRPHMANVLLRKGYVTSIKDAFNRFLAKGKPAFVDKYRMDCAEAIRVIRDAGGLPVLAHPVSLGMEMEELDRLLSVMAGLGLKGLEAYYSDHSPERTKEYIALAERHHLVITGGSDFHGTFKADIALGSGKGTLDVPFSVYENLRDAITAGL